MFKSSTKMREDMSELRKGGMIINLRRRANAFLLPMRFREPRGDEAIVGHIDEEDIPENEMITQEEKAGSREGPRAATGEEASIEPLDEGQVGTPTTSSFKKPNQPSEDRVAAHRLQ